MKPSIAEILLNSAGTLGTGVAPHLLDKPYALGHTGTIGLMLVFLAQEAERAAETLVTDNAEMRAIFRAIGEAIVPTAMKEALVQAGASADRSLHVRVLEADNAELKTVLVALHEAADNSPEPWAREAQRAIWTHLKAAADRRALVLPTA